MNVQQNKNRYSEYLPELEINYVLNPSIKTYISGIKNSVIACLSASISLSIVSMILSSIWLGFFILIIPIFCGVTAYWTTKILCDLFRIFRIAYFSVTQQYAIVLNHQTIRFNSYLLDLKNRKEISWDNVYRVGFSSPLHNSNLIIYISSCKFPVTIPFKLEGQQVLSENMSDIILAIEYFSCAKFIIKDCE